MANRDLVLRALGTEEEWFCVCVGQLVRASEIEPSWEA
jgi:hypothetical protein